VRLLRAKIKGHPTTFKVYEYTLFSNGRSDRRNTSEDPPNASSALRPYTPRQTSNSRGRGQIRQRRESGNRSDLRLADRMDATIIPGESYRACSSSDSITLCDAAIAGELGQPISQQAHDLHGLIAIAIGTEFAGAGDRVRGDRGRLGDWIGERMVDVVAVLPDVDEGRAPLEEMSIAVAHDSEQRPRYSE
jgi:hypothetical protein